MATHKAIGAKMLLCEVSFATKHEYRTLRSVGQASRQLYTLFYVFWDLGRILLKENKNEAANCHL